MPSDLQFRSAIDLGAMVRTSELSPVDLVTATLDAASGAQPTINAFVTICADEALSQAREAEAAVQQGSPLGPLHGIPFIVKDLTHTAGVRTTFGSRTREHWVPTEDAVAVARLKAAGAILVGKTTTPEFGHKPFTDSPLFGTTVNPWNHDRTCGG
ncbi:MAG: amidase, partial [Trueperaceae bacterium]